MSSYRLTPRAADEIIDIEFYSIAQFGSRQAERYKQGLAACFELISSQPMLGRIAKNIGSDIRRHEHGSHVIFYRSEQEGILILAVVHERSMPDLEV